MKLRSALLASALFALPLAAANAQPVTGLYVGGGLGVNFLQQESFTLAIPHASATGKIDSSIGPAAVVDLGWGFGNGLRAEIEGDYRNNKFKNSACTGAVSCGGLEQKTGGMVNALYDFVGLVPMVQPYVGVGVGYQQVYESNDYVSGVFHAPNNNKGSFAYQAILGAAFPIASAPGLAFTAEYRFMGLAGNRSYPAAVNVGAGTVGGTLTSTNDFNHSVLIGLRYNFGVAPPAPPPTPVAEIGAKTFLVFFDWDKYDLTARAAGIVHEAADYSTHTSYTRIDVDGNTDTSGTPAYNQGLSERRARTVAAELVRDGVPQNVISMHAYGDTKLLVPTGPGVREPQNRRVEIVFH
ncbi:MAG: OmpA family protein [Acetobacteraceae bacterium]|jgi:outer membrane protein OmpA-like peptidoglycan-associated protein